jgi:hypothetical protein
VSDEDLEPRQNTTLGESAAELRRPSPRSTTKVGGGSGGSKWMVVGGGGVLVLGGIIAFLATRPPPAVPTDHDQGASTGAHEPSRPALPGPGPGSLPRNPEQTPDKMAEPSKPAELPPSKPAVADPEMARIELTGLPPGTSVMVDGRSSALPVRVPKGVASRILLRSPQGVEKTIDVDGKNDQKIAVTFERERQAVAHKRERAPEPAAGRPRSGTGAARGSRAAEPAAVPLAPARPGPGPGKSLKPIDDL